MQYWRERIFHFRGFWIGTSKESGVYPDGCEADDEADEENAIVDSISSNIITPSCIFSI